MTQPPLHNPISQTQLKSHWHQTLNQLGINSDATDSVFDSLVKNYSESARHYHNLAHLQSLLGWLEAYRMELHEPELVALTIWYHDAIYSTLRKDNETRSAALAHKQLSAMGLATAACDKVALMIRQTADHMGPLQSQDPDLLWFLDFDLSILGAEENVYLRYAEQIRKEYRLIPELIYRNGRSKLLRQMLQAEYLYQTPAFRRSHERQARHNLLNELRRLSAEEALGLD